MNAKEAKEISHKYNIDADEGQYKKIMTKIDESAHNGEYKCHIYEYMRPDVEEKLKSEGFSFSDPISQYNDVTITISWKQLKEKSK